MEQPSIPDCDSALLLMSARDERSLTRDEMMNLESHLSSCETCNEVADDGEDWLWVSRMPREEIGAADTEVAGVSTSGSGESEPTVRLPTINPSIYAWDRQIAQGGMGRVLRARDRRLGRDVAIKELISNDHADRFEREARLTARLQHPSIISIHEAGRWPSGEPFYAMNLVEGNTLDAAIARAEDTNERLALLPHVIDAVEAIAYAHDSGVIHRDIKPLNIMVGTYGQTVILDWGLAKDIADLNVGDDEPADAPYRQSYDALTVTGAGTPHYMPPEQAGGQVPDERVDVYALGATLYHVLAGEPPYGRISGLEVIERMRSSAPRPLDEFTPDLPEDLRAIVSKAMAREPEERYPSARELAADLRRYQTGQLVSAYNYTFGTLAKRWVGRHRVTVALAGIMVACMAVGGAVSISSILDAREHAEAQQRLALAESERARAAHYAAEERNERLALMNARLNLDVDPTATLAYLRTLTFEIIDDAEAAMLAEDAIDRGVARHVWQIADEHAVELAFSADGQALHGSTDAGGVLTWSTGDAPGSVRAYADGTPSRFQKPRTKVAENGSRAAYIDESGQLQVRDLATGEQSTLPAFDALENIDSVVMSASGNTVAAVDDRQHLVVAWRIDTGARHELRMNDAELMYLHNWVAISGDDRFVATHRSDGGVQLWDLETGNHRLLANGVSKKNYFDYLAFSPDHRLLASTVDDQIAIWRLDTGERTTLSGHRGAVRGFTFSADGNLLASTSGDDKTIRLWDVQTGDSRTLEGRVGWIFLPRLSPDGRHLLAAEEAGPVWLWDVGTNTRRQLLGHKARVSTAAFSRDGRFLATGDVRGEVRLWDLGRQNRQTVHGLGDQASELHFSPDERLLALLDGERRLRLMDAATGQSRAFDQAKLLQVIGFTPDGGNVLARSKDGQLHQWDVHSGDHQPLWNADTDYDVQLTSDGKSLIAATRDGAKVQVWERATGDRREFAGGKYIALAPDGKQLAVATAQHEIAVYHLTTGERQLFTGHKDDVQGLEFSRDSTRLVSFSNDDTARVWTLTTGESQAIDSDGPILDATLSPDNRQLALALKTYEVHLVDLPDGERRVMRDHGMYVKDVAFSRDGRTLISASFDRTVRLRDLGSDTVRVLRGLGDYAVGLRQSPSGNTLAVMRYSVRDYKPSVRLWSMDAPTGTDQRQAWIDRMTSAEVIPESRTVRTP